MHQSSSISQSQKYIPSVLLCLNFIATQGARSQPSFIPTGEQNKRTLLVFGSAVFEAVASALSETKLQFLIVLQQLNQHGGELIY